MVDYREQKVDLNRVQLIAVGNLIKYSGEMTTRTADPTSSKELWNSVLSIALAKYMCIDIENFYLCAPMTRYEYIHMPLKIFPHHMIDQYDLNREAKNRKVYLEIWRLVCGLPQSGNLIANEYLKAKLAPAGY